MRKVDLDLEDSFVDFVQQGQNFVGFSGLPCWPLSSIAIPYLLHKCMVYWIHKL